jgi:hypothetical protein
VRCGRGRYTPEQAALKLAKLLPLWYLQSCPCSQTLTALRGLRRLSPEKNLPIARIVGRPAEACQFLNKNNFMASSQRKVGSNEEGKKGGLLRVGGNILPTLDDLRRHLVSIEGHGYKAYQTLEGAYDFGPFTLFIDHAQRDPFAPASRLRVRLPMCTAGFPEQLLSTRERRLGLEDFITRACFRFLHDLPQRYRGTGKSGLISIQRPGQEVLERTSVRVTDDFIEARLSVGLPASGRRCWRARPSHSYGGDT